MKYPETARRLREAMDDMGIKAVDLSEKTGISRASLSQYMNGSHAMRNDRAGIVAEILGVNPLWLMGFDAPKYIMKDDEDYYLNPKTAQIAQKIFDDPYLHALFDAARDSTPENMEMAAEMLRRLKGTNPDG